MAGKIKVDGKMPPKDMEILSPKAARKVRQANPDKRLTGDAAREDRMKVLEDAPFIEMEVVDKRKMAHGGYVCAPNPRKGNIDMRKTGMTRNVKDNRKKRA